MDSKLYEASKIIFLSDVHLGAFSMQKNNQLEQQLIGLINFAEAHGFQMVILGDLFDYWIEYPGWAPSLGRALLRRFQKFHRTAAPSLYITGNHDSWTLGHFADFGFDVEPTCRLITLNKKSVFLAHGDATGPEPETLKRPFWHRIIRSKPFLKVYRGLLPPKAGLFVMKHFSNLSRRFDHDASDPQHLNRWAQNMLQNTTIDLMLCGHDHLPRKLDYHYGTYINLGNFQCNHSMVVYNNGRFALVEWQSEQQQFRPLA